MKVSFIFGAIVKGMDNKNFPLFENRQQVKRYLIERPKSLPEVKIVEYVYIKSSSKSESGNPFVLMIEKKYASKVANAINDFLVEQAPKGEKKIKTVKE